MTQETDKYKLLRMANNKVSQMPEFLAYYFRRYADEQQYGIAKMAELLDCTEEDYFKLGLCLVGLADKAPDEIDMSLQELNASYTPQTTEWIQVIVYHTKKYYL